MLTLNDIKLYATERLSTAPAGNPLSTLDRALVELAVAASPVCLNQPALERATHAAIDHGATPGQIQEVITVVSGLGVHSLMVASPLAHRILAERQQLAADAPLDEAQQALWAHHVGDDPFWARMEQLLPGFLKSLLSLCSDSFRAFFDYCAVPWKTAHLRAYQKELIALAVDATPGHRFFPGFRLHLENALQLGVGGAAIEEVLALARNAPEHTGVH